MNRISAFLTIFLSLLLLVGLGAFTLLTPAPSHLPEERRAASPCPDLNSALKGSGFAAGVDAYLWDRLPLRRNFRTWGNRFLYDGLGMSEVQGYFRVKDAEIPGANAPGLHGIGKDLSPLHPDRAAQNAKRIGALIEARFGNARTVTLAMIPDKAFYLRPAGDTLDCSRLFAAVEENFAPPHQSVDLVSHLSASSYYATDIHWRCEALAPVASTLGEALSFTPRSDLRPRLAGTFAGAMVGGAALGYDRDELYLMEDPEGLLNTLPTDYADGTRSGLYDASALTDGALRDAYDIFLRGEVVGTPPSSASDTASGSRYGNFFLRIRNPNAPADKKLVVFRDSFARSLAPWLASSYREILFVDMRLPRSRFDALLPFDLPDSYDLLVLLSAETLNGSDLLLG